MALSQVGWSLLYMWLLEGRSEAQFHLFVSLAFIAFYRDWSVMLTASFAAIVYPAVRIALLPESFVVGPVRVVADLRSGHLGIVRSRVAADRRAAEPADHLPASRAASPTSSRDNRTHQARSG